MSTRTSILIASLAAYLVGFIATRSTVGLYASTDCVERCGLISTCNETQATITSMTHAGNANLTVEQTGEEGKCEVAEEGCVEIKACWSSSEVTIVDGDPNWGLDYPQKYRLKCSDSSQGLFYCDEEGDTASVEQEGCGGVHVLVIGSWEMTGETPDDPSLDIPLNIVIIAGCGVACADAG